MGVSLRGKAKQPDYEKLAIKNASLLGRQYKGSSTSNGGLYPPIYDRSNKIYGHKGVSLDDQAASLGLAVTTTLG